MDVMGVDFSGAAPDSNTWVSQASLDGRELILGPCFPVSRDGLACMLESLPKGSVAAIDFPFSVPLQFAWYWMPEATTMTQLWSSAAAMDLPDFIKLRDDFVSQHGEPKRVIDLAHPEAYSCLHKANPNMVPMTFRGMQMLARLWPGGCDVPPLPSQGAGGAVLLEVMPGAVLKALGLPYKGYKNGARKAQLRETILDQLSQRSPVTLLNLEEFREPCLSSHDCLDAVVAALAAALWTTDRGLFTLPNTRSNTLNDDGAGIVSVPDAVLNIEGWLYAPDQIGG